MIIISPYARKLRNGKESPKNYPFWPELVQLIRATFPAHTLVQIGVTGEEKLDCHSFLKDIKLKELALWVKRSDAWIAVDNFFPHFASYHKKRGIVLFGQSDPEIFGHPENINLLKDKKYLRSNMYDFWENAVYLPESFIDPRAVIAALGELNIEQGGLSNGKVPGS